MAAPIRRQAAQEPTPGAAAAAEPATACTHEPVSPTAVLKFEAPAKSFTSGEQECQRVLLMVFGFHSANCVSGTDGLSNFVQCR